MKSWKLNWTGKNSSIIGQSNWDLQKRFEGLTKYLRIGENGCALAVEWQKALECVPRVTLRDTLRLLLLLFLLLLIKHPSWWNARYSVLVFKHKPLNIVQRIFSLDDEDESNCPSFASLLWSGVWPQADILLVNIYSLSDKLDSSTSGFSDLFDFPGDGCDKASQCSAWWPLPCSLSRTGERPHISCYTINGKQCHTQCYKSAIIIKATTQKLSQSSTLPWFTVIHSLIQAAVQITSYTTGWLKLWNCTSGHIWVLSHRATHKSVTRQSTAAFIFAHYTCHILLHTIYF